MSTRVVSDNYELLDSVEGPNTRYEVLGFKSLIGNAGPAQAAYLHPMKEVGLRYRQVRIGMKQKCSVRLEAGALHYMRGAIQLDADLGDLGKMFRRGLSALASGETIVKPIYTGTGEIFLEPSFQHFLLVELSGEPLVCDDGMFLACDEGIEVKAQVNKVSSGLFGGDGWVQPRLDGTGCVVLASPVPFEEIVRVRLDDDVLKVDGKFALARFGDIEFRVEKSTRSLLGSAASGEGLLQVFRGTGEVWLNPTEGLHRPFGPVGG